MNEIGNLEPMVTSIVAAASPRFADFEVIIVDDGSADGTCELADRLAGADARIRVHHNGQNRGLAYSYRQGIALAGKAYTGWVAGNNIVPRKALEDIYDRVGEADVILSYVITDVRGTTRRMISRLFTTAVNVLFGQHLRYYTGPCVYRTEPLRRVRTITEGSMIVPEIVLRMVRSARTYIEVPLQPQARTSGRTKTFHLRNVLFVGLSMARLFWDIRIAGAFRGADAKAVAGSERDTTSIGSNS